MEVLAYQRFENDIIEQVSMLQVRWGFKGFLSSRNVTVVKGNRMWSLTPFKAEM